MKRDLSVPAAVLSTFKVGGSVQEVVTIENEAEVVSAISFSKERGIPVVILGGGSNVLFPEHTLHAVVLKFAPDTITRVGTKLVVSAGAKWEDVVSVAVREKLWGIENLSGIPGTVGGAVVQNIGAYGAVLSDVLVTVTAFDTHEMSLFTFHVSDCAFGYRTSMFKQHTDRYLITKVTLELSEFEKPNTGYTDLSARFPGMNPTLTDIRDAVLEVRARKFPDLALYGTAGSYFLNPIVSAAEAQEIQNRYPEMPVFPLPEGGIKIPLGWYFEHILKIRGYIEASVEAWREQALVIVAHPGATSDSVRTFTKKISERARNELGILITPEVREL